MDQLVEITSFTCMGDDLNQIKDSLKQYAKTNTLISFNGNIVEVNVLLQFYEYLMVLNRARLRKCQQKGIEEALKRKSEGNGTYGRPRMSLPNDFDDRIRRCLNKRESLSNYCKEIGMKRSTFYKYAKEIQKGMKIEADIDR